MTQQETKDKDIILSAVSSLIELEKEKIKLDKFREENVKKELEVSAQSGQDAAELSRIDLNNQNESDKRRIDAILTVKKQDFYLKILSLLAVSGLLVFLIVQGKDELAKILAGGLVGFLGGYGYGKTKKDTEQ